MMKGILLFIFTLAALLIYMSLKNVDSQRLVFEDIKCKNICECIKEDKYEKNVENADNRHRKNGKKNSHGNVNVQGTRISSGNNYILEFPSLDSAVEQMRILAIKDVKKIIINYDTFPLHLPHFEASSDLNLFLKSKRIQGNLINMTKEELTGEIHVVENGTFKMFYECGWKSKVSDWKVKRKSSRHYEYLAPLIVPMAYLFQHFVDGTLPKLFQSYEFLKRPEVRILLEKPNAHSHNIYKMLYLLNISSDRVIFQEPHDEHTVYHARYMINTCITPPLHPTLWKMFRHKFYVNETRSVPWSQGKVIFLKRKGTVANGRNVIHFKEVKDYLEKRYKENLVIFPRSDLDFDHTRNLFSKAKIILGPHGGAFYNIQFAPKDTVIIEFAPLTPGGGDPHALPHAIFWRIADLIGQNYWRIPIETRDTNMNVDIKKVHQILNTVDPDTKDAEHFGW